MNKQFNYQIAIKNLFVITIVLFFIGCSKNTEIFLEAYECDKKSFFLISEDLLNCTGSCKKILVNYEDENPKKKQIFFSFLVDKDGGMVLQKIYKNKEIVQSNVLKECKVFDDKNWDCSSITKDSYNRNDDTIKMNNGIFVEHHSISYYKSKSLDETIRTAMCGK